MTEIRPTKKFAEELLSQDREVSQFDSGESTMNLEKALASIQRRAQSVRRASLIASALAVVLVPCAILSAVTDSPWLIAGAWACFYCALIVAAIQLFLYWYKYRPALEQTRSDLQISMIADLQRQILAIGQRLDERKELQDEGRKHE